MSEQEAYFELVFQRTPESIFTFKQFELLHDATVYKAGLKKTYIIFSVVLLLCVIGSLLFCIPLLPWLLSGVFVLYTIYFAYQYRFGYLSDYKLAKKNMQLSEMQRQSRIKEVTVQFFTDHAYIGSFNENRMFYYQNIEFIQRIENIVIFYLYPSKEKHLEQFSQFVVNLEGLTEEKKKQFLQLVFLIKEQYHISALSERKILL